MSVSVFVSVSVSGFVAVSVSLSVFNSLLIFLSPLPPPFLCLSLTCTQVMNDFGLCDPCLISTLTVYTNLSLLLSFTLSLFLSFSLFLPSRKSHSAHTKARLSRCLALFSLFVSRSLCLFHTHTRTLTYNGILWSVQPGRGNHTRRVPKPVPSFLLLSVSPSRARSLSHTCKYTQNGLLWSV